jgi:hypothetical protein
MKTTMRYLIPVRLVILKETKKITNASEDMEKGNFYIPQTGV